MRKKGLAPLPQCARRQPRLALELGVVDVVEDLTDPYAGWYEKQPSRWVDDYYEVATSDMISDWRAGQMPTSTFFSNSELERILF